MDDRGRRAETGDRKTDRGMAREMARMDIILSTAERKEMGSNNEDGRKRKYEFSR
jgi:hypothetical protein